MSGHKRGPRSWRSRGGAVMRRAGFGVSGVFLADSVRARGRGVDAETAAGKATTVESTGEVKSPKIAYPNILWRGR